MGVENEIHQNQEPAQARRVGPLRARALQAYQAAYQADPPAIHQVICQDADQARPVERQGPRQSAHPVPPQAWIALLLRGPEQVEIPLPWAPPVA